jgi:hypothetical protein
MSRCPTLPVIFSAASAPAVGIIDRVLGRNRAVLEQISSELAWPMQRDRVIAAARGLYRGNPGIPTWAGFKQGPAGCQLSTTMDGVRRTISRLGRRRLGSLGRFGQVDRDLVDQPRRGASAPKSPPPRVEWRFARGGQFGAELKAGRAAPGQSHASPTGNRSALPAGSHHHRVERVT